jgi:phenylalanyl-tRNA synthetase beta chain
VKIPYRWLREFVEVDISPTQAADLLINAGIEVASVTPVAPHLAGLVAGEIEAIERELGESHGHRLLLCRVSTGRERFSVVCGAPNVVVGVRAAFAPPGATLPDPAGQGPRRVGVARIRGVDSQGMLCSERELGIGEEHEAGIVTLDSSVAPGSDLVTQLGLDDSVLDIEITPNRADCLSVVGVARELAALSGGRFRYPALDLTETDEPVESLAQVRIEDPDLCHRFTARVISDVKVAPSPLWLALRLRVAGLRPISNVVDVTNYVMWELGHPLHAFDHASVVDATIVVRRARPGERITTLDGQDRALDPSVLLITDPRHPIGIAGVMGGADTGVTDATSRVLLESAYFQPASIRRTARALGLRTDAAYRFERGADIDGLVDASARAARLMAELAGGTVARGVIDVYPVPRPRPRIRLRLSRVRRLIGVAPPLPDARQILERLRLVVRDAPDASDALDVEVPTFRRDLAVEDDLVEELIRVWGYDRIPATRPAGTVSLVRRPDGHRQAEIARRALVGAGVSEAVTAGFSDPARAAVLRAEGDPQPIALVNPMSQDAALVRQHPLEGLLGAVATNVRRQAGSVRLFEIARTYVRAGADTREPRWVAIAVAGARTPTSWYGSSESVDVYDAKGLAELVLTAFGVEAAPGAGRLGGFEAETHGALVVRDTPLAEFGEVAAPVREEFGLEAPVFAAVVSLDAVGALERPGRRYRAWPRFPAVQRDMAFIIPEPRLTAGEIETAIRASAGPLLRGLTIFDVFQFPDGRRSLAWRLTFQAEDRTLTDEEVHAIQDRVAQQVSARFGIILRTS